jgi:hypothetical protein
VVVIVSVLKAVPFPEIVTELGLNVAVAPDPSPDAVKFTVPLKLFTLVTVTA